MDICTSANAKQVLVIEDDRLWREQLEADIAALENFEVCQSVESVAEACHFISKHPGSLDYAIVDLMLPDGKGHEVIRHATAITQAKLMVCSSMADAENVLTAIELGVCGYIVKGDTSFTLAQLFELLEAGGAPISPSVAGLVLKKIQAQSQQSHPTESDNDKPSKLTERETEILNLVARGYKTSEVAQILELTYNTVSSHIKNIYRKLQVNSRTEAIFEANQQGLIDH